MPSKRKHEDDEGEDLDESNHSVIEDEEGGMRIDDIYVPPPPIRLSQQDIKGPRIIIHKIVNTNFKSFGYSRTLGPFHQNFNAIIGPNGCGKSNVIDSLLFVFGYRASKIRSKKLSVLIHKSEKLLNVACCSVAVHFIQIQDNKDSPKGYDIIPDSEFVISRTANRDNSSFYQINDNRVQYKDLAMLLRKHGVDLDHNRFLILQGEVEQISLMKPKAQNEHDTGMLEYLEDIIGTTRFKEPIVKLNDRIEVLTEKRSQQLNLTKIAEQEKDELKEPMYEAIKYLELENENTSKHNVLYQKYMHELSTELLVNEEEKAGVVATHTKYKDDLAAVGEEIHELKSANSTNIKKADELINRKNKLSEAFDVANNQDVNLQAESLQVNKRRKKVIETLKQEAAKLKTLEAVPEKAEKDIVEYEERQVKLQKKLDELDAEKNKRHVSLRTETIPLQNEKDKLQNTLIELRKTVDETKSQFNIAESELKIYVSNDETQQNKLTTLKATLEEHKQKYEENNRAYKELNPKIPLTEKSLRDASAELENVKRQEAEVIQQIRGKRQRLEERRCSMQASKSRGRVLDTLMQQKREGKLNGLFGRLGDLGAIDQKYDVAVSTACGPLDNIVVDTVDTAQWCIEFLKAHDVGRATFIALEKQEHLRQLANAQIQTPENVSRLYDLIRVEDDRVKTAFYYSLRDTLVANNLDQASRIAYGEKRYRVVTLKGDLIETSGTMSGGGRSVLKGRMGQSVTTQSKESTSDNIETLEVGLSELEQKCRELRQRQAKLEEQVSILQKQLKQMTMDCEKYRLEIQFLKQQSPVLVRQINEQEQKVKSTCANPQQVKSLQEKVRAKQVQYEKACEKSGIVEAEVNKINKEIQEKTDRKLKNITKEIAECEKMLATCKADVVKFRVSIKNAHRNSQKAKDKIANLEEEKTECETSLLAMQAKRNEIEKDAAILLENIEKLARQIEEVQEESSDVNENLEKLTAQSNEIKAEIIEVNQKLKTVNAVINDKQHKFEVYKTKLSKLVIREIPQKETEVLKTYTPEELTEIQARHVELEIKNIEEKMKSITPNLKAIEEYYEKETHYLELSRGLKSIIEKRTLMTDFLRDIRKKRQDEFHAGFSLISTKFKEMYQMITLGGDAELDMVDSYDPFAEGVILNVRPPKKSWKVITNLSGGEKTLSSLALVFALHYYKPSPFYFMDEIDAALDFKNVSIVGHYIKERTKNAQFIIISLRPYMFELADQYVGIFKRANITRCVAYDMSELDSFDLDLYKEDENDQPHEKVITNGTKVPEMIDEDDMEVDEADDSVFQNGEISRNDLTVNDSMDVEME